MSSRSDVNKQYWYWNF